MQVQRLKMLGAGVLMVTVSIGMSVLLNSCSTKSKVSMNYSFDQPPSVQPQPVSGDQLRVMGTGQATVEQMKRLLLSGNDSLTDRQATEFARIYIEECKGEGVNWDVAFVQMCLETNYLRFGGQVDARQNNFCGLGAVDGGASGASFPTVRHGVRAQVQHLKAYGSTEPLNTRCIDPRFELVSRGSAPYVRQLTGAWATDKAYDRKIARLYQRMVRL
jgi:hypothetical protein